MALSTASSWFLILNIASMILFGIIGRGDARVLRLSSWDEGLVSSGGNESSTGPCSETCVPMYGIFPCAQNIGGNILLVVVYNYLLTVGDLLMTEQSKVLLNVLSTGVFGNRSFNIYGAIIFRLLKVLPGMIFMTGSGVWSTKESAQSLVSFGIGVYAGTTVFNLTVVWGICAIFRTKRSTNHKPNQTQVLDPFSPTTRSTTHNRSQTQVSDPFSPTARKDHKTPQKVESKSALLASLPEVEKHNKTMAGIMLLSLIPYVLLQFINAFDAIGATRLVILVTLAVSSLFFILYFAYQFKHPENQETSMMYENLVTGFLKHVEMHASGDLIDENGEPNRKAIKRLFKKADINGDGSLSPFDLQVLVLNIMSTSKEWAGEAIELEFAIKTILMEFDLAKDGEISREEFVKGCERWIRQINLHNKNHVKRNKSLDNELWNREKGLSDTEIEPSFKRQLLNKNAHKKKGSKKGKSSKDKGMEKRALLLTLVESSILVVFGIGILTFLGGPVMMNMLQLSDAIGAPSFMVSFLVVPLTMASMRALSIRTTWQALIPERRGNANAAAFTFSEICDGVFLNNVMGLTILLSMVYLKDLTWNYTAEVLIILVVCSIVGVSAIFPSSSSAYSLIISIFIILLYPFSLGLYYILAYFLGWS